MLHGSPAAAVAIYDPRLGAAVVASHSREWQVVNVTLPAEEQVPNVRWSQSGRLG